MPRDPEEIKQQLKETLAMVKAVRDAQDHPGVKAIKAAIRADAENMVGMVSVFGKPDQPVDPYACVASQAYQNACRDNLEQFSALIERGERDIKLLKQELEGRDDTSLAGGV